MTLAGDVLAAAAHCTALPVDLLAQAYSDEFPDPDLPLAAIRGSLIVAANWVADELLNDADELAHGGTIEDTSQLIDLPPQFEPHYTPGFARQFLLVTWNQMAGWIITDRHLAHELRGPITREHRGEVARSGSARASRGVADDLDRSGPCPAHHRRLRSRARGVLAGL